MKIPVEEDPTVESLFSKEVDKPLIVGIIVKEPSNLYRIHCVSVKGYTTLVSPCFVLLSMSGNER